MPRFELKKSKQVTFFWEIDHPEGAASFTLRFGKVGAEGDSEPIVREFPTPFAAKRERDRLVAAKKTEGYVEVTFRPAGPRENPELLQAILEDPKDAKRFLVYADWLQSIGDPHGELIAVHAAMAEAKADPPRWHELAKEEKRILREHEGELLFGLGPYLDDTRLKWRLGFVSACDVSFRSKDASDAGKFVEDLLDLRTGKLLRELTVRAVADGGDVDFLGVIATLESRAPARLRSLSLLGNPEEREDDPGYHWRCDVGDVGRVWKALPGLRRLALRGTTAELGKIGTSRLEELSVEMDDAPFEEVRAIAEARWPKLESFRLGCGRGVDGELSAREIESLLGVIPAVTSLGIRNFRDADEVPGLLAASAIAPKLEALDLSLGGFTDAGAEALASDAKLFPALARIDVSRTTVHLDRGVAALQRAFPGAEIKADRLREGEEGPADRYDEIME